MFLNHDEISAHLQVKKSTVDNLANSHLLIQTSEGFPSFQLNDHGLDNKIISIFQRFKKGNYTTDEIVEWFTTYNDSLKAVPVDHVKLFGADDVMKFVIDVNIDIDKL